LATGVFSLLAALSLLPPRAARAVPYASALTNASGFVSFRLNEAADNVQIVSNGGGTTNNLGPLPAGLNRFALGIQGTFQVVVSKAGAVGFLTPVGPNRGAVLQISLESPATRFFSPRGVAVNHHPASPQFGRIYIANATSGTVSNGPSGTPRTVGDGLYALNADTTDALGQGDAPLTGGLNFSSSLDLAPYRISIGQDDNVYVCDFGDTNGGLYVVSPDIAPNSGTNVIGGPAGGRFPVGLSRLHGSIAAAVVEGSLATSNLAAYVIDEDLQTDRTETTRTMLNSLWRHDLREHLPGLPFDDPEIIVAAPWVGFASQIMDLSRGPNGFFYVNDYRSPGTDWAGLYVHDAAGQPRWNSLAATRALLNNPTATDWLRATGGGAVSPNGDLVAVIHLETSAITVVPLIDGLPDLANRLEFQGFPESTNGQGRDVAFDAAGNLYAISSGVQALRVFSPGGRTTAMTGSDGTFQVIRPPGVRVAASAPLAAEGGANGGLVVSRTGDTSSNLVVSYTLSGSAQFGSDYSFSAGSATAVTIPAGESSVIIHVTAADDALSEPVESLTMTLLATAEYDLGASASATVTMADNDPAVVRITVLDDRAYERLPLDGLTFLVERTGQTNTDLFIQYTLGGTASSVADYTGENGGGLPARIWLPAGQRSQSVLVQPLDDASLEGDETMTITLLSGSADYQVGSPNSATGLIEDDEVPATALLFADDFDTDTSTNWITFFGANNGLFDAEVRWAFDYGALGIPPAPHSTGTTRGVFVQVNKTNAAPGGSAAVNLYPAGRSFTGRYALRFDMLLHFGAVAPTEHVLAGLNHSGLRTNRVTQSTDVNFTTRGGDGLFFAIASDGTSNQEWAAYTVPDADGLPVLLTNRAAATLAAVVPSPPYGAPGSPGIGPDDPPAWAEVELSQQDELVSLKLNNRLIYSFTNHTGFTRGNVMLGHSDQFDSIGSSGANGNFVLFDNVRVVTPGVYITSVALAGGEVRIEFVAPAGQPSNFRLQSCPDFSATAWDDENSAVITATGQGFRAVTARAAGKRFYRVRR
jgi:hypothetical protein